MDQNDILSNKLIKKINKIEKWKQNYNMKKKLLVKIY